LKRRTILLTEMRSAHVPTRVSIPFDQGEVKDFEKLVIRDSSGRTVPSQGRSLLDWKDGSAKWGLFVFDPGQDEGPFKLEEGKAKAEPLLQEAGTSTGSTRGRW